MNESSEREALRHAVDRLPVAVVMVDAANHLRALNKRATALFERESVAADLLHTDGDHPLGRLIAKILAAGEGRTATSYTLTFPSGRMYTLEPSRCPDRSQCLLVLYIAEGRDAAGDGRSAMFDRWTLTEREREVAMHLCRGLATQAICEAMDIAPSTLKTHMSRILEKSGSRTRSEFLAKLISGVR